MRITKVMMEQTIQILKNENAMLSRKLTSCKERVKILTTVTQGTAALTIALERSTEAVAHIISDLNRKR